MNTSDLRETLASHATFEDDAVTARVVGVRERVRLVRRRRRAAVGGAVAAVLAIGAAGVAIPKLTNNAGPASRELAGHTAPATLESLGYTYTFARGVEGDGKAVLKLAKSEKPRLVTWATEGENNRVSIYDGVDGRRASGPDFSDFAVIHENAPRTVSIKGEGRVAAAVYEISALPKGTISGMGTTFRPEVVGAKLLGVEFGKPGETEIEVPYVMPVTGVDLVPLCQAPKGYSVLSNESEGSGLDLYESCANGHAYQGWSGSSSRTGEPFPGDAKPGDRLTARAWLAKKNRRVSSAPGIRLGLAVYERVPLADVPAAEVEVDQRVESEGRAWRHERTILRESGGKPGLVVDASTGPVLVLISQRLGSADGWSGEAEVVWQGRRRIRPELYQGGNLMQYSIYRVLG